MEISATGKKGAAGACGADVRYDCRVEIAEAASTTIHISSRVEALYGASVRRLAEDALDQLGLAGVSVNIEDTGALPFTLMARLEAAAQRYSEKLVPEVLPDINPATRYAIARDRLRRTRLYVPGNTPRFLPNVGLHGPDAIILDLEDSVPSEEKDAARILVRNALRALSFHGAEKMVRINAPPLGLEDVRAIVPHGVHTLILPKVEDPDEVAAINELARAVLREHAIDGEVYLIPTIESPRGGFRALAIADAAPSIVALSIGLEDYVKEIGAERTPEGRESWWVSDQVLNAARAVGIQPLASVYPDVDNADGLRSYAERACVAGFEGVGCIHPRQVRIVHEAFTPVAAEIEQARRMVAAFEQARAEGIAAVALDGRMIDAPVVERARRILRRAAGRQEK
jgi:citrate lyase subunit beta/citryl-CoA lyase